MMAHGMLKKDRLDKVWIYCDDNGDVDWHPLQGPLTQVAAREVGYDIERFQSSDDPTFAATLDQFDERLKRIEKILEDMLEALS